MICKHKCSWRGAGLLAAALVCAGASVALAHSSSQGKPKPLVIAKQGNFFVGGEYYSTPDGEFMAKQMYVEYHVPHDLKHKYPLVLIHGGMQIGAGWNETPDGREGWTQYFLREGYAVYVVDQVGRGRSVYQPEVYGPSVKLNALFSEQYWSAGERHNVYPHAYLHNPWPKNSGLQGREAFNQLQAAQVPTMDWKLSEALNIRALEKLVERIGPAMILGHSQSGNWGWLLADRKPGMVKAVLAMEPPGAPVSGAGGLAYEWGIAWGPVTYSPAVSNPSQLKFVEQARSDRPDLDRCWLQASPARQLPRMRGVPSLILVTQASYHTPYMHCWSKYMKQAGVDHTFIRLEEIGIRGTGHLMMLEQDNAKIAGVVDRWIRDNVDKRKGK